ncbi:MAG TPA: carboxypeptidase-like regulatory domain-containing protein [Streptosporangiaceae bacterium]
MVGRHLAIAALSGMLASGLAALPAQASPAAARQPRGHGPAAPTARVAVLQARERWLSEHGTSQQRAAAGAALRAAIARATGPADGVLTGIVRDLDGRPVSGACVTATGPSGSVIARSRANGRYLLPGLRSGQYVVHITGCANSRGAIPRTYLWPRLPASVSLGTGQVKVLPAVTAITAGSGAFGAIRSGPPAREAGTGGISGRVTGAGHPVQGICVVAEPVRTGFGRAAPTSKTGRYHITGLKPGRYQVEFSTEFGCGNSANWLDQWYPGVNSPFPTAKVVAIGVKAGKTKTGVNANLKMGGEISGTTRTRAGKAIGHICVEVRGRVSGGFLDEGFASGPAGRYALHGVFPGRYTVGFSTDCGNKANYAPQWWRLRSSARAATVIKMAGTKILRHVDARLDRGAVISGTVKAVNGAGQPLAGICVSTGSNRGDSADAVTGKDGRYRLAGLLGGRYVVEFDPSCFGSSTSNFLPENRTVSVARAGSRTGVNAYLQPGAGISGVVTGPQGHPLQGVCVRITNGRGNAFAESNSTGSYSITGLAADSYIVEFSGGCGNPGSIAPQFYNNESNLGSSDPITLTAGEIATGIDAAMRRGATISGMVTDAAGHRLSGACVGIADPSEVAFGPDEFDDIEFTTAGKYRAVNLAPGPYQVNFGCGGGAYVSHWYRTNARDQFPDLLSIPAGLTAGVNGVLRHGGSVTGVVTTKAGQRVSNTCLYLVDAKTGFQVLSSVFQGDVQNGRYKLTGLAAGSYKVFFYGCGTKYASQWYRGRSTERAADPVRVTPGRTTSGVGAVLAVGGTISGRVVDGSTGKPVRNECVDAFDSVTQGDGFAQTDRTGHYVVRGLATGRYLLTFSRCYAKGPDLAGLTRPTPVTVSAPHAVTGIDVRLAPGGDVSGTVTAGAHPQIGTCVELIPLQRSATIGFAGTGIDGSYTATGLTAGQYQVLFNDPTCFIGQDRFASQWYNGQPTASTADIITVTAGHTTSGISAKLQPLGSIRGTVTDPGHAPVSGECITAVPIGKDLGGLFPVTAEVAITTTAGSYSLADLQPGTYKVKFSTGCGDRGFKTQWWQAASSRTSATAIAVSAGAVVSGIDASLTR